MSKTSALIGSLEDRSLDLYLKEISKIPLLAPEEEVTLAKRIKANDVEALWKLTRSNLRFVVSVAKQYSKQGISLSDLINEGNLGLLKAAKKFDETKGYKFISYAVWWIRQAILQALAEQSRIVRLPLNRVGALYKIGRMMNEMEQDLGREPTALEIAQEMELPEEEVQEALKISNNYISLDAPVSSKDDNTLVDMLQDTNYESPDQNLLEESLVKEIERALETITDRESKIVSMYYGINHERTYTLEEIGKVFNLTRERVRQIKEKAIFKLKNTTRSKELQCYLE